MVSRDKGIKICRGFQIDQDRNPKIKARGIKKAKREREKKRQAGIMRQRWNYKKKDKRDQ